MNYLLACAKTVAFLVVLPCLWSCAPVQWNAILGEPAKLSWPPMPNPKKVEYLGTLRGFTPVGRSLGTILFGQNQAGKIVKPVAIAVGGDGIRA